MTVTEATSTNGKWRTFSSTNATLATCLSEVMNELDAQNVPLSQVRFVFTHDTTNFVLVAIKKSH